MTREGEISIRRAVPNDAPAIASVLYEAFREFEALYTGEAFRATTISSERVQGRIAEGPVWIALADCAAVGTVSAVPRGEALYVRGMAVLPSARGKGVARLLLDRVEEAAVAGAHARLLLSTTPFLTGAIRLYERAGFRFCDEGPGDLFGTPLLSMVKRLGVT